MKLISVTVLILSFAINGISNEQFVFPPKFQTPGQFVSDSSLYLPIESHTPIPYFPLKKLNNLPFPYLPPTGTKSPVPYPSPFPLVLSSTLVPNFDEDDDDKDDEKDKKILMSSPKPQLQYSRNRTERSQEDPTTPKRDIRQIPRTFNYQHPIDRVDIKFPSPLPNGFQTPNPNQTSRSMIISAENHRNDFLDQIRSGSSQNPHFISPPGVFIPTTEPAIPILRLSNEMDLDGSFSYEALGADQTHYVQHSHMENLGSDKAEQVVEGSYSYVGDNGQTYTVHYIADSNGFRATGDHLPVAPPIPEIIQRSIQYNLAEEAKKPPHLKSWTSDAQDQDFNEINDKTLRFPIPPQRNLFTGRTPEAFSYDFSQRSNTQNNLATAASTQVQMKTIADFTNNQSKVNNHGSPILPQVTFLASQGAHIPSMNSPTQSVARMFTTEKSIMPQLINYEADDGNKGLWRWQYGLNSNHANQAPEKNTISRSFGEGDDVMINFSEMTPDQYTKMLQSQVESNPRDNIHTSRHIESLNVNDNTYNQPQNNIQNVITNDNYKKQNYDINKGYTEHELTTVSTEKITTNESSEHWYKPQSTTNSPHFHHLDQHENSKQQNQEIRKQNFDTNSKPSSDSGFISANQFMNQEYNFEESSYEPKRLKSLHPVTMKPYNDNINQIINNDYEKMISPSYTKRKINEIQQESEFSVTHVTPTISTESNIKFSDFITHDNKDEFKPVLQANYENKRNDHSLGSEIIDEFKLNSNIFLSKVLNAKKNEQKTYNKIVEDTEKQLFTKNKDNDYSYFNKAEEENNKQVHLQSKKNEPNLYNLMSEDEQRYIKEKNAETKSDKIAQYVNVQSKPSNEVKSLKKKPLNISDVLNYITMKNHFESNKVKPKNNPMNLGNYNPKNEVHYIPMHENKNIEDDKGYTQKQNTHSFRPLYTQPGEIRGNIKNYKVLQRQNNILSTGYDNDELRRELVPPPMKLMQAQNFPPLGRAGPSTRSYLPPTYI